MNKQRLFFYFGVFIFLVFNAIQGFDLADEGFYMSFYQQFFESPATNQYNFMYWLTGLIGALALKASPFPGLITIRILGIMVTLFTILISERILKNHIKTQLFYISTALLVLMISNDPKSLYYNTTSAFFMVWAIYCFQAYFEKQQRWGLLAGGMVLGASVFLRLPNLLLSLLALPVLFMAFTNSKKALKSFAIIVFGWALGFGLILFFIFILGHIDYFMASLQDTKELSVQSKSHGRVKILKQLYFHYRSILLILSFVFIVSIVLLKLAKKNLLNNRFLVNLLWYLIIFIISLNLIFYFKGWFILLKLNYGISIGILVFFLFNSESKKYLKLLMSFSLLGMILLPIGSNGGMYMVGRYSLWLAFPLAVGLFYERTDFTQLGFEQKQIQRYKHVMGYTFLVLAVPIWLYSTYYFPYFDLNSRKRMWYTFEHPEIKGILTVKERVKVTNELVQALNKRTKPGDYLLAFEAMPMIHYLTHTKPWLKNSWPGLYQSHIFEKRYQEAFLLDSFPLIVMQKQRTTLSAWPNYPDPNYPDTMDSKYQLIQKHLTTFHYDQVWSNEMFIIYERKSFP